MIEKYVEGRAYAFIDASNIYHSFRKLGWKIDFLRLKQYLKNNMDLGKIYFYTAYDPDYPKQGGFVLPCRSRTILI